MLAYEIKGIIDSHKRELVEEAKQDRMIGLAHETHPTIWRKLCVRMGKLLITWGTKLQARHATYADQTSGCSSFARAQAHQ